MEFAIGAISGMTGVCMSHPIDTIKTHIQNGTKLPSYTMKTLYKGILPPLMGVGLEKAIVFGIYNNMQKKFNNNNRNCIGTNALCGGIAGLSASLIVAPYERLKIHMQNGNKLSNMPITSLFKGLNMTLIREFPGFAIYFSIYEQLKYKYFTGYNKEITPAASFLFGGLSGSMAWVFIYPQDRIKTLIQSNNSPKSITDYIKFIKNDGGGFYKGFSFALYRAILLHSGTFTTMEILTKKSTSFSL